ncbi:hypothetical protein CFC21_095883 [Triticum aestivum]|uniref:Uncharacterized protein n=2 Tax=Triticum aestivum TaxID=4565 RepID=A0A9R1LR23_WHEAT|nr:sucrose transport protein SUT5-like [Triticum aestivum]KAF7093472.1 hypothetical protein CFC21_095883 [Triticum aestivum]
MAPPGESGGPSNGGARRKNLTAALRLFLVCMVSGGIQYICALEMSLLSPYSQNLGIPHKYASMIWIGGPIAGFLVNPIVGYYSDRCTMRIGRRRPFIILECLIICISGMLIGFSADIGQYLGDTKENCSTYTGPRWAATAVYVVGFLLLDCVIHTAQASVRAMMSDLSAANHGPSVGQAIFSVWMAIGSILGYAVVAYGTWHQWFPSLKSSACCNACADLKGAFLTAVVLIVISTVVTMLLADEQSLDNEGVGGAAFAQTCGSLDAFIDLFASLKNMSPAMFRVLALTAFTWLSWFPFLQYNTDWMGREIYHGNPNGVADMAADKYNAGVREGAIGLLLCSASLGATSFLIPKLCRKLTSKVIWSISLFSVFLIMAGMVAVGVVSTKGYDPSLSTSLTVAGPDNSLNALALTMFALIGIPQAVLYSVPWAVAAQLAAGEGGGQGVTVGAITNVISLAQLLVGLTAGPIDGAFNKGNAPAFGIGGVIAFICAILVVLALPDTKDGRGLKRLLLSREDWSN